MAVNGLSFNSYYVAEVHRGTEALSYHTRAHLSRLLLCMSHNSACKVTKNFSHCQIFLLLLAFFSPFSPFFSIIFAPIGHFYSFFKSRRIRNIASRNRRQGFFPEAKLTANNQLFIHILFCVSNHRCKPQH